MSAPAALMLCMHAHAIAVELFSVSIEHYLIVYVLSLWNGELVGVFESTVMLEQRQTLNPLLDTSR